jgi:hypothetical protein
MQKSTMQSLAIATAGTQQAQSASPSESAVVVHPTHEAISARAYAIYLDSGMQEGQCKHNWCQAESDLQATAHAAPAKR